MNQYFLDKYKLKMVEVEEYVDEISKITYECTTLHIIVSLSKKISKIESILDRVSKIDKASLMYTQTELLNINKQLSKNLPYKIGYGKKAIRIKGLLKEIKFGNYDNALKIVKNLAEIQPINISEELETISRICSHEDIHTLKEAFINSWLRNEDKATRLMKCSRPECGNKHYANSYYGDKFCSCGAPLFLLKEVEVSEANYIALYAKYILSYIKKYESRATKIKSC